MEYIYTPNFPLYTNVQPDFQLCYTDGVSLPLLSLTNNKIVCVHNSENQKCIYIHSKRNKLPFESSFLIIKIINKKEETAANINDKMIRASLFLCQVFSQVSTITNYSIM